VGGLAIICLAVVAIFYIRRRHPRASTKEVPESPILPKFDTSSAPEVMQLDYSTPEVAYTPPQSLYEWMEGMRMSIQCTSCRV